jgi:adenylylsulfate kinase-like enzyme
MIIWLTGQLANGKTTLANSIITRLSKEMPKLKFVNIDGDDLRLINKNKDYFKEEELRISAQQFQLLDS